MMLDRIDALTAQVEELTTRIDQALAPFASQVAQLDEIPGVGKTGAQEVIAEIGVEMARFPTPGHLASWARFPPPQAKQSAGRSKPGSTGKGNPWLAGTLGEAAMGAARTKTFLDRATTGSPGGAASSAPWSRSATPSSPPPGTCSLIPAPGSPTSARTGTTGSPHYGASASSSPNWNGSPARR